MKLTEKGEELFKKIEPSINNILEAEEKITKNKAINFGTYNTIISKMLSECINKYYRTNPQNIINVVNNKIEDMIDMLNDSEIDIVLSKKINSDLYDEKKQKYIKLGELEEVIITNNNSELKEIIIDFEDLKDEIIYVPRNNSLAISNFINKIEEQGLKNNVKRIDSATIIKMVENGPGVGILTKEYIEEELEKGKISILKTRFGIERSEIGIYLKKGTKFKELTQFIEILKERFKQYN